MELHRLALLLLLYSPSSKADWCYTEPSCGPATWTSLGSCNGSRQSPIDIPEASANFNGSLGQLVFTNYSNKDVLQSLSNTGHTVEVSISDGVSVSGGGLPATYIATAFHFHWGNGTVGSEHRLTGRQYPMEAVDSANKSQLAFLSELLDKVSSPGMKLQLNSSFSLNDLLGDANLTMFYRYMGSLTTPTCDEAVLWSVFKTPITVPSSVVKAFSSGLKQNVSGNLETLQNNFRSPQPLNGRNVQASFQSSTPLTPNSTAVSTVTASSTRIGLRSSVLLTMITSLLLLLTP
ncbi:carbonic anhydrase 4-like [Phyllobates terribilis]|uniref:carbonic anhydrase 4-like n=1 Tax=Phyllobates terribilis TaxID=111132 RepID=UPI003CCAF232